MEMQRQKMVLDQQMQAQAQNWQLQQLAAQEKMLAAQQQARGQAAMQQQYQIRAQEARDAARGNQPTGAELALRRRQAELTALSNSRQVNLPVYGSLNKGWLDTPMAQSTGKNEYTSFSGSPWTAQSFAAADALKQRGQQALAAEKGLANTQWVVPQGTKSVEMGTNRLKEGQIGLVGLEPPKANQGYGNIAIQDTKPTWNPPYMGYGFQNQTSLTSPVSTWVNQNTTGYQPYRGYDSSSGINQNVVQGLTWSY
jgi:hypothetical protein